MATHTSKIFPVSAQRPVVLLHRFPVLLMVLLLAWLGLVTVLHAGANTILVVGDSLSSAYRIKESQGWVSLLQERLGRYDLPHEIVNASFSGDHTASAVHRLPRLLREYSPAVVIIELGGNDGLRGLDLEQMHANLESMVESALRSGAKVMITGMKIPPNYGPRYTSEFAQVYTRLASEHDLVLVPFLLEGVGGVPGMMQDDGIHPNAKAQPVILDNVWPFLYAMLTDNI